MAIQRTMIDNSDRYACKCPACGKVTEVSGDKLDEAYNTGGQLSLSCCGYTGPLD